MTRIKANQLQLAIEKELADFGKESSETVRNTVEDVADKVVNRLKATSPKKRGKYARGWRAKATVDTTTGLTKTVHNQVAGLTHLLEHGHAKQNGGRVSGIPHIKPAESEAIKALEEQLRRKL